MRSFQESQSSRSAWRMSASPLARASTDCAARIVVMARALPSSFFNALRSPPLKGVGWCFEAIGEESLRRRSWGVEGRPAAVLFVTAGALRAGVVEQPPPDVAPDRRLTEQ